MPSGLSVPEAKGPADGLQTGVLTRMLRTASTSPGLEQALVAVGACGERRAHGLCAHTLLLARGPRALEAPFPPLPEGAPCSHWDASLSPPAAMLALGRCFQVLQGAC